jgi:cytochrome c biogenesis protein CcmG, thiol:disulfide interchange protein DsbE
VKRWLAFTPLAALLVLVIVAFTQLTGKHPEPASFSSPTRAAPDFDVAALDGGRLKLADFRGRPVLLNMWGSYCAPCKLEHPLLMQMAAQGVEIVGILYKDPHPDDAKTLLEKDGNPFTHIGIDADGDLGIAVGISGVPESFLIDGQGRIVKSRRFYFTEKDVPDFVAAYKAEQAKSGAAPTAPQPAAG